MTPNEQKLRDALDIIMLLAEWHCDDEADEKDPSPTDMTAHVNGLIRQRAKQALASTAPTWVKCSERMPTEKDADWLCEVLVQDGNGDMFTIHWELVDVVESTHWQPTGLSKTRPQPPKE